MAGCSAQAAVTVSQGEYHGWAGVYRLSNGTVDLVFVPQIGRIMRYGYVGERNVLWENTALAGKTTILNPPATDWQNYGGDKLWPSPQSVWGWPPDPVSDSGPQTVKVLSNRHLLVTGPESRKYGVRFQREIALNPSGTGVTIRNTMTNVGGKAVEWGIWEVAQADNPEETTLAASPEARFPGGYKVFGDQKPAEGQVTVQAGVVKIRRRADHSGKIGGRSAAGWIESRWGESAVSRLCGLAEERSLSGRRMRAGGLYQRRSEPLCRDGTARAGPQTRSGRGLERRHALEPGAHAVVGRVQGAAGRGDGFSSGT